MSAVSVQSGTDLTTSNGIALTAEQQQAHDSAIAAVSKGQEQFLLSGLAGAGKTTTVVEILRTLKSKGVRPCVCTPTGKAAYVINQKQNLCKAETLHAALSARPYDLLAPVYDRLDELDAKRLTPESLTPEEIKEEAELLARIDRAKYIKTLDFEPCDIDEFTTEYDVVIFDESSMIGEEIYNKLIGRIPLPKIFVGDKAQLPPVNERCAVDLRRAHADLKTIMRQKKDSGILSFAHGVFGGKVMTPTQLAQYADIECVKDHRAFLLDKYLGDHQVVVWTNNERHEINERARAVRGVIADPRSHGLPVPGEKIMVDVNRKKERLLRGEILTVVSVNEYMTGKTVGNRFLAHVTCKDEYERERLLLISLTDTIPVKGKLDYHSPEARQRRQADLFGVKVQLSYAITCHKAQGSEWDKVVYVGSMMPESNKDWREHWYTGCTRAKNKLVIASYHFSHG